MTGPSAPPQSLPLASRDPATLSAPTAEESELLPSITAHRPRILTAGTTEVPGANPAGQSSADPRIQVGTPAEPSPPSDTAQTSGNQLAMTNALLQTLIAQMTETARRNEERFAELAAGQNVCHERLDRITPRGNLASNLGQEERPRQLRDSLGNTSSRSNEQVGGPIRTDLNPEEPRLITPGSFHGVEEHLAAQGRVEIPEEPAHHNSEVLQRAIVDQERDREIENMRAELRKMNSRVHQATSSAPEIDRVFRETQNTPFSLRLLNTPIGHPGKIKLSPYGGMTDPSEHLRMFNVTMGRHQFSPEEKEAVFCQMFVENLVGPALTWFSRLKAHSIHDFEQLSTAFLTHYSIFIQQNTSNADLWALTQGPKESLRTYIDKFKAVVSRGTVTDDAALPALRNGLWFESPFKKDMKLNKPRTLEDALHRASIFIEIEEEQALLAKKYAPVKASSSKDKIRDGYFEPRQHYDGEYLKSKGKRADTFLIQDIPVSAAGQPHNTPSSGNQWLNPNYVAKDGESYCDFHKVKGHPTSKCRTLQEILLKQYEKGEINLNNRFARKNANRPNNEGRGRGGNDRRQDDRRGGNDQRQSRNDQRDNGRYRSRSQDRDNRQNVRTEQVDAPRVQDRGNHDHDDDLPPPRQVVNMIMGGLFACNDSVRSIKSSARRAMTSQQRDSEMTPVKATPDEFSITFTAADSRGVQQPHNDPLVIQLRIADCDVSRVLIDTGSSVDLIFKTTLDTMNLSGLTLKPKVKPLTGFAGDTTETIGTVKLPIRVGGTIRIVKFLVVDRPAIYNAILGTPWIHSMRAVVSTYHQCIKFPTESGVRIIRGDQRMSRTCFIVAHKLRRSSGTCHVIDTHISSDLDLCANPVRVIQVNIDSSNKERCVGIGAELEESVRSELVEFLKKNASTFAWSTSEMPGINTSITSHELNVDPTYRPVKQKRRKLNPERAQAVANEVERLTAAGFITEVKYPDWLANPVVVKKKSGAWRICIDFTDLNKACPKDSFPLPRIDQIVEATAGNELLSFMDAFSGYNQIRMHPDDQEKTAFITDRGTYCYKVMPFGLKNAGATYQRLVNKMFADELGQTMEVYIDDMLVKSALAKDHVGHLRKCFHTLNQYGMKLNPTKCTFGVTSGEFLGYIVTQRGIEANPKQIGAVLELPSPKSKREIQRLTGRIAALNRFISRSTDKCLPFYQLLRGNKEFIWDERCEEAFQQLKAYLSTPPILAKPEIGETLYLYIAVSTSAVSGVLVREDRGEQKPVFYVSKSLDGAESRYPALEKLALAVVVAARKLRPYFQSHTIAVLTNQPLRTVLHSPSKSGRMAKWAVELSEYDIEYRNRTAAKSQVLADFLVELSPDLVGEEVTDQWILYVDGSASRHGSGVGIKLESPTGEVLEQSFRLAFPASNNEAEYESLIAGLRLAKQIGAKKIQAYCDSQLVSNQFSGEYEAKSERMDAYLSIVRNLAAEFAEFSLTRIPRGENTSADALAALASTSATTQRRVIPVESIDFPSIQLPKGVNYIGNIVSPEQEEEPEDHGEIRNLPPPPREPLIPDWRNEILQYIKNGTTPADRWAARRLKRKSARYVQLEGRLFRWSGSGVLLTCLHGDETIDVMKELHEGAGGNHSNGRALAIKIKNHGHYWPTMIKDCERHVSRCEKCQRHAPMIHIPTELLNTAVAPYPFMRWAMDIVGPLPRSRQKSYILIMTDYYTKWVEAESYSKIHAEDVRSFVWRYIICRHGLPYEIITDNGPQFISGLFEDFCAKWKIKLAKSTPRYPQGNGQAEATNKTILDGIKKRLDEKKGLWADELDGILWSYRTTPRTATNRTPFSLSHGIEAMAPSEVGIPTLRRTLLVKNPVLNDKLQMTEEDFLEERRDQALLRIQNYQQLVSKYYNKKVKGRHFQEGDFVLRKVFENTAEWKAGKLGANWEGPYLITKLVQPGVYELSTLDGEVIPRSWNSMNLKRFYY